MSTIRLSSLLLFLVLQIADAITTHVGLAAGGDELNVLPALILARFGELAMYLPKALGVAVVLLLVIGLRRRYAQLWCAILPANILMVAVVLNNLQFWR